MPELDSQRELIATACRVLAYANLTELYTGHVSHRIDDDRILIPRHRHEDGLGLESVTSSDVMLVTPQGESLEQGEPPGEFPIHGGIFAERSDVVSVVHAHPLVATGLATGGVQLKPASLDAAFFGGPVPVYDPGPTLAHDEAIGAEIADALGDRQAVLIRGHGAVTVGESVPAATTRMWLLERASQLQLIGSLVGDVESYDSDNGEFLAGSGEGFLEEAFVYLERRYEVGSSDSD